MCFIFFFLMSFGIDKIYVSVQHFFFTVVLSTIISQFSFLVAFYIRVQLSSSEIQISTSFMHSFPAFYQLSVFGAYIPKRLGSCSPILLCTFELKITKFK